MDTKTPITLKSMLALYAADVDIFLLKENDQETDKNRLFSVSEIREQLTRSLKIMYAGYTRCGVDMNMPIPGNIAFNLPLPIRTIVDGIEVLDLKT